MWYFPQPMVLSNEELLVVKEKLPEWVTYFKTFVGLDVGSFRQVCLEIGDNLFHLIVKRDVWELEISSMFDDARFGVAFKVFGFEDYLCTAKVEAFMLSLMLKMHECQQ